MTQEDEVSEAVRQGVANTNNFYLMKPFDHEYLLLKVGAALKDWEVPRFNTRDRHPSHPRPYDLVDRHPGCDSARESSPFLVETLHGS